MKKKLLIITALIGSLSQNLIQAGGQKSTCEILLAKNLPPMVLQLTPTQCKEKFDELAKKMSFITKKPQYPDIKIISQTPPLLQRKTTPPKPAKRPATAPAGPLAALAKIHGPQAAITPVPAARKSTEHKIEKKKSACKLQVDSPCVIKIMSSENATPRFKRAKAKMSSVDCQRLCNKEANLNFQAEMCPEIHGKPTC